MDSFGIGNAPDAETYQDKGADTLGHIAAKYPLKVPNLLKMGLSEAYFMNNGTYPHGLEWKGNPEGAYFYASEQSLGKDTPSGHWELMGVPVTTPWSCFPPLFPSFPEPILEKIKIATGINGFLGNVAASGTEILKDLGEEHLNLIQAGIFSPIIYTSSDSVMQIAAHEELFGLERLYDLCQTAREVMDASGYMLGRVIARPFLGMDKDSFKRTANRHDYSLPPPSPTLLEYVTGKGGRVTGIGKISDIYAGKGISKKILAGGNDGIFAALLNEVKNDPSADIIMANFVDFDMLYGHRRDIQGYAEALESFDSYLPMLKEALTPEDMLIITADHGCDPSFTGANHTRECIPVLIKGDTIKSEPLSPSSSFSAVSVIISDYLGINYPLTC